MISVITAGLWVASVRIWSPSIGSALRIDAAAMDRGGAPPPPWNFLGSINASSLPPRSRITRSG
jgi:hypothetical protein